MKSKHHLHQLALPGCRGLSVPFGKETSWDPLVAPVMMEGVNRVAKTQVPRGGLDPPAGWVWLDASRV